MYEEYFDTESKTDTESNTEIFLEKKKKYEAYGCEQHQNFPEYQTKKLKEEEKYYKTLTNKNTSLIKIN